MNNYIDLIKNNSSETYTPVQARNLMVNKYKLKSENNRAVNIEQLKMNIIGKGFLQTIKFQQEIRDLTKFSIRNNQRNLVEINTTLKSIKDLISRSNVPVNLEKTPVNTIQKRIEEYRTESIQTEQIKEQQKNNKTLKETLLKGFDNLGDRLDRMNFRMSTETLIALGVMLIQKLQSLGFNKDTLKGMFNFGNIGKLLYKDVGQGISSVLTTITKSGKSVFESLKTSVNTYKNLLRPLLDPLKTMSKGIKDTMTVLKSGMGKAIDFVTDIGSAFFKVLEKIPGMSSILKSMKFIGKYSGLISAGFAGYDFYQGVKQSERITGQKNTSIGQKIGAGTISAGTGFVNSLSEGVNFLSGGKINLGRLDERGVYNAITGNDNLSGSEIKTMKYKKRNGRPVDNMRITSYPGSRSQPKAGASTNHAGTDIAVPIGTPVYATAKGVVQFAGVGGNYGLMIIIRHANNYETRYAHLSKLLVGNGEFVYDGQEIAKSGNSGNSTGPHLHYELRQNGTPLNPFGTSTEKDLAKYDMHSIKQISPIPAPAPNPNIANLIEKGIVKNEGNVNPTSISKDNIGYTFGKMQFNSATNPQAWKDLGFSNQQLKDINSGKFNKQTVEKMLQSKSKEITKMDKSQLEKSKNYVSSFFGSKGLDVSDPFVFAQLMDITNQFSQVFDDKTVQKLTSASQGNKITLDAIKKWRMSTLQGKSNPSDQLRRFNNINKTLQEGGLSLSSTSNIMGTKLTPSIKQNKGEVTIKLALNLDSNFTKLIAKEMDNEKKNNKKILDEQVKINNQMDSIIYTKNPFITPKLKQELKKEDTAKKETKEQLNKTFSLTRTFQKTANLVRGITSFKNVNSLGSLLRQAGGLATEFTDDPTTKQISTISSILPNMITNASNIVSNIQRGNIASGIIAGGNIIKGGLSLGQKLGSDTEINPNLVKAGELTMNNINRFQNTIKSIGNAIAKPSMNNIISVGNNLMSAIPNLFGIGEKLVKSTEIQQLSSINEVEKGIMSDKTKKEENSAQIQPRNIVLQNTEQKRNLDMSMTIEDFPMIAVMSGVFD